MDKGTKSLAETTHGTALQGILLFQGIYLFQSMVPILERADLCRDEHRMIQLAQYC